MDDKFLIANHPWKTLKEALEPSFPNPKQLADMKRIMDGETNSPTRDAREGMKMAGVKNLYELILWGLRTGVIKDDPIPNVDEKFPQRKGWYEAYPLWKVLLHDTTMGMKDSDIQKHGMSQDSINFYRKMIQDKFNLGNSAAKFIRFAFASTNPISGPGSTRGFKPFKPWTGSTTALMRIPQTGTGSVIDPEGSITKETPLTAALKLIGIRKGQIPQPKSKAQRGSFWNRSHESIYHVLELAKNQRDKEIKRLHPIANRHPETPEVKMAAKQLAVVNSAWDRIRILFARNGYTLPGDEELLRSQGKRLYIPGRRH
jgi:hypothetical protein